jgi:uncharacterized protein (DUF2147 family)
MRENRSPDATSASRTSDSFQGCGSHTAAVVPAPRAHRGWRRLAVVVAPLLTAGFLATGVAPAAAATSLSLITTGSSNTTVGYQIFANLNLMNAGVTPTGLATFKLYSPTDPSCTWPIFTSTVAVASTSVNSSTFMTNQAGTYRWTASYGGDANYYAAGPTPCSSASADVVVAKSRNILKVAAQAPSGGLLVTKATLSGYLPNGTITLYVTGPNDTYCAGAPIFTTTITVNGAGTYTSAPFDPPVNGTYTWRASYGGDSDNQGASLTGCLYSGGTVVFNG